jgi:hypothetical protein
MEHQKNLAGIKNYEYQAIPTLPGQNPHELPSVIEVDKVIYLILYFDHQYSDTHYIFLLKGTVGTRKENETKKIITDRCHNLSVTN